MPRTCLEHDADPVTAGTAFTNIKGDRLYPSVGMKKPSEHLRVNFGQSQFVFDIDSLVEVRTR
jgi:Ran-binding protein 9/10